ncbi:MAG: Rab family GTPase [Candidatus Thorarchaeota archaeon]
MPKPKVLKIIIAGDGGVGKTTLLHRYVEGKFIADTKMTIGVQFHLKEFNFDDEHVLFQIWDFGGQERFRFLLKNYAIGAKGALLLFDLTRIQTLENIKNWVDICRTENPKLPILFVGSKSDLADSVNIIDEFAVEVKEDYGLLDYIKLSSKTGENVEFAFELLANKVLEVIKKE